MPERCPRCGSPHDSLDGVANHAWKSQDDAHADVTSKDEGIRVAIEEEYSPDDSNANSGDPTLSDGPPDVPDPETETVTAPCGHEFETADLEDGKTYRCTDCDNRFKYND